MMVRGIVKILISKLGVSAYGSRIEQILGVKILERIGPLPEAVKNDGFARYREVVVNMDYYPPCPNKELTVGVGCYADLNYMIKDYMKNYSANALDRKKSLDFARINSA
ncbi:hypothetical protein JHK84_043874 [Glycine max]|nr:hypothetical protein JHK84_043874 [Glycine max]